MKIIEWANSTKHLFMLVGISFVLASVAFTIIEGVPVLDGFYWASTTMSTVGYGDISPVTTAGKLFTMFFQLYSIFILVPLAISNVLGRVDISAYTHAEQEWMEDSIKKIAAVNGVELNEAPLDHEALL